MDVCFSIKINQNPMYTNDFFTHNQYSKDW